MIASASTVLLALILVGGWWISPTPRKNDIVTNDNVAKDYETMYATLERSIDALDGLVDETYRCWQISVRNSSDIDAAIEAAFKNKSSNVRKIETNDKILFDLVKKIQSTSSQNTSQELYDSMLGAYDSYKDYYEFGYNVSGSFESFKAKKEPQKKETKSYLNKFKRNL